MSVGLFTKGKICKKCMTETAYVERNNMKIDVIIKPDTP